MYVVTMTLTNVIYRGFNLNNKGFCQKNEDQDDQK